ncbi:type II toxin-antitoxin system VapC family toxin [Cylindrospermum sp. FACHB-282]|uniref:type II toxin-antitoxin system VapC family toxin n=1 Tax=Cylindrospermum sp. FACHB-282 TaxID=2692794 RepID=UPI0016865156|nr:PIN domain-containing protein [Cylindrospermum sp. FACHB-282]MBD2386661.1 type II toxin-antitoxin system VapC family toxin [Cylindrospermum sp. FACHB-282]
MRRIFVDTFYWAAFFNPRDEWHSTVKSFSKSLVSVRLVTTDEVLTEFLNFFSAYDTKIRQVAIQRVQDILQNDYVQIVPQSHDTFLAGLELYKQRADKEYSLTDCISMQTMKQLGITEVLTHDKHFTQEGFTILFG